MSRAKSASLAGLFLPVLLAAQAFEVTVARDNVRAGPGTRFDTIGRVGHGEKFGPPMAEVPAGWSLMGSNEGDSDERPQRRVYLDAFLVDKYEVTNEWYGRFMKATGAEVPRYWKNSRFNAPKQPVVGVTWHDAAAFCKWLGRRLPTEAEWEKAARGTDGRKYPWGEERADCNRAIMDDGGNGCGRNRPWRVGSRPLGASPYGALDMAGNVWEWVQDRYDKDYYKSATERNPKGPSSGEERVLRGGSWDFNPRNLWAAYRDCYFPEYRDFIVGFRCAKAP